MRFRSIADLPGSRLVWADITGSALFVVSATTAAVVFDGLAKVQGVVVALVLFAIGVVTFIWGYWSAVQRSRTHDMSVVELYFLLGPAVPRRVKLILNGCLVLQTVVSLATALARGSTPDNAGVSNPGSTLAFGVLVPMLGLGLNGLWAASHGGFGRRRAAE
ncbi:MAG: hypothetical protein ACO3SP_11265 [Ilumatobacteraceae bacterium]